MHRALSEYVDREVELRALPPMTDRRAVHVAILVAALGYFVDIYDLVLFSIVRVASLRSLGVPEDKLLEVGIYLINMQRNRAIAGEQEAKRQEALERRSANAPAPGAKPTKGKKRGTPTEAAQDPASSTTDSALGADEPVSNGVEVDGEAIDTTSSPPLSNKPQPGARPKKRNR